MLFTFVSTRLLLHTEKVYFNCTMYYEENLTLINIVAIKHQVYIRVCEYILTLIIMNSMLSDHSVRLVFSYAVNVSNEEKIYSASGESRYRRTLHTEKIDYKTRLLSHKK